MSNDAKRTTLYFSQEDVEAIETWAKKQKLSFSKAAIALIHKGIGRENYKTTKIDEHEQKLQDYDILLQKYETRILALEQKMQRLTELLASTRLGEIRDYIVWETPPQKQISIRFWYDCSDPNQSETERYGLTKYELIQKLFGDVGRNLFQKWCKELNLNEEQEKDYLCQISGAKYQQVKIPKNERASNRYVINHLFQTNHLSPTEKETQLDSQ